MLISKRVQLLILLSFLVLFSAQVSADSVSFVLGERTLCKDLEGVDVAILQRKLCQLGFYASNKVDGIYGQMTCDAVKELQKFYGIAVDGIAGPETIALLPVDMTVSSRSEYDRSEILILARVIHGEARGESFKGQVGVGAVILNRVEHSAFPDTIREVVLEDGQFSCIFDGQVNYYPSSESLNAARAALMGYDPTRGALFFYNPTIATNVAWISKRTVATLIDNHLFLY